MQIDPQIPVPQPLEVESSPRPLPRREFRWYHKFSAVIFIVFLMEVGAFLLIFPWTEYWDHNLLSSLVPEWNRFWDNSYMRGAVSGLGVVNFYIAFLEVFRLRRFARR